MHFQNRTLKIPKYRYLVVEVTKFDDNLFQRCVTPRTRGAQFLRMQKLAPQGIMMNDCLRRKCSRPFALDPGLRRDDD